MARVIAEAGPCDDSVEYAIRAASAAKAAGCWAFKVQMYRAETLVAPSAVRYDTLGGEAETQADMFAGALPYSEWEKVKIHCDTIGIHFFASVWDLESINVCQQMGVTMYKIGSADITYRDLIEAVVMTGKPLFLSTGASSLPEIRQAVRWVERLGSTSYPLIPMVCTLSYPTLVKEAHLGRIPALDAEFKRQYSVGYSDHTTSTVVVPNGAAIVGANYLEKHFTLTPGAGFDHDFALDPAELATYVAAAEEGSKARSQEAFNEVADTPEFGSSAFLHECELAARRQARRSLVATSLIPAGAPVMRSNTAYLRPGTGLPPSIQVWGQKAHEDIPAGTVITKEMLYGGTGGTLTVG